VQYSVKAQISILDELFPSFATLRVRVISAVKTCSPS
jgi:hypothetical protein